MQYKRYLFFAILILLTLGKWLKDQQNKNIAPHTDDAPIEKTESKKGVTKTVAKVDFKSLVKKQCPKYKHFKKSDIQKKEGLAHNIHYKKDGETFRLRTYLEDGENGSFEKLIHYKEDDDGFPWPQPLPPGKEIEPSQEYIESFHEDGEIIHDEQDYRLELKDGRTLTISEKNGKIVKLNSQQDDCLFQK